MRFSTVMVAATLAMFLTGGITVASTIDPGATPRPVNFTAPTTAMR